MQEMFVEQKMLNNLSTSMAELKKWKAPDYAWSSISTSVEISEYETVQFWTVKVVKSVHHQVNNRKFHSWKNIEGTSQDHHQWEERINEIIGKGV